jgi:hypothetical protein
MVGERHERLRESAQIIRDLFGGGYEPRSFDAASQNVTAGEIAETVPCGPDLQVHVAAIRKAVKAGYTSIALVQIGADHQDKFAVWASAELLPALREI